MKPFDAKTLQVVGEALYGPLWQSAVARDLDVAVRTVQRWGSGEFAIPDGVWPELAAICKRHSVKLHDLATKLYVRGGAK